jgi:hypothetical protein
MSVYAFVTKEEVEDLQRTTNPTHDVTYVANHKTVWAGTAVGLWRALAMRLIEEREAFEKVAADFADRFYDGDSSCVRKVQEEARRLLSRPAEESEGKKGKN